MSGDDPLCCLLTLAEEGICAFGANCSLGPEVVVRALDGLLPYALSLGVVLIAKPNAGLPVEGENGTVYPLAPPDLAAYAKKFLGMGCLVLGGCCGTTPAHIAALKGVLSETAPAFPEEKSDASRLLCTSRKAAPLPEKARDFIPFDEETDLSAFDGEAVFLDLPDEMTDLFLSSLYLLQEPAVVRCSEETEKRLRKEVCGVFSYVRR
jgi:hypothetical protein